MGFSSGWRGVIAAGVLSFAGVSSAQVVIDNGPFQTHANGGPSNAPRSVLQTSAPFNLNSFGFGCQVSSGNRVADNFAVPAGVRLRVTGFRFFAYQTTATSPTINAANFRIWNGAPNAGGTVSAGDGASNVLSSVSSTGVYRVEEATPTSNARLIMQANVNLGSPVLLNAGANYWLDWQLGGTLASGPWAVPVTILGQANKAGSNALQFLGAPGNSWGPVTDEPAGTAQDLCYAITGAWVVNPVTTTNVLGTVLGGNNASLGNSDNNYFAQLADEFNTDTEVVFNATSPTGTISALTVITEHSVSRDNIVVFTELQRANDDWDSIDIFAATQTDQLRSTVVAGPQNVYLRAGNALKARVRTAPTESYLDAPDWVTFLDLFQWEIVP